MIIPHALTTIARWLLLAASLGGLSLWYFGPHGPFGFVLEWDEEVQLHDASVITIHIKRRYERLGLLSRWNGVHRATDISLDVGAPLGRFSTGWQGYDLALVEHREGVWYFGLLPVAGRLPDRPGNWQLAFVMLRPDGRMDQAGPPGALPAEFIRWNVLPDAARPADLARFQHSRVRLADKLQHWQTQVPLPGDERVRLRQGS